MNIKKGDIYWLKLNSDFKHPHVVVDISADLITVCAITTNQKKSNMPGNVVLEMGEGNLEKQSIVEVYKEFSLDKNQLGEFIGTLSLSRVDQIINGIGFVKRSFFTSNN